MAPREPDPGAGRTEMARFGFGWLPSLLWALAVVAAYLALVQALGQTFYIEPTSTAVAAARRGRLLALPLALGIAGLAVVPVARRRRRPVLAALLVGAPGFLATAVAQADASGIVGLLLLLVATPLVVAGLVLGVLPVGARRPAADGRVVLIVVGCAALALVLAALAGVAG